MEGGETHEGSEENAFACRYRQQSFCHRRIG
jgi:hypothetical protein